MMSFGKSFLVGSALSFGVVVFGSLAMGDVVLNGSTSLPHNGYFMYRTSAFIPRGSYVHFPAPDGVADAYKDLSFVKRVVGRSGDVIETIDAQVCINATCRDLLPSMVDQGYAPLSSGHIPDGFVAVFGDAANSLDSRYATLGLVGIDDVSAVGFPITIPHWKDLRTWLDS